jgi:hypothetical protein
LLAVSVNLSEHKEAKESGNFCRFLPLAAWRFRGAAAPTRRAAQHDGPPLISPVIRMPRRTAATFLGRSLGNRSGVANTGVSDSIP